MSHISLWLYIYTHTRVFIKLKEPDGIIQRLGTLLSLLLYGMKVKKSLLHYIAIPCMSNVS